MAGHETTSTFLTWTLYRLATNLEVQRKLRDEIHAARRRATEHNGDDELGADDLMALPYLDAVVREVGRLDPPVASTVRMCTNDDVLPLSQPFTTPDGKTHDSMAIKKGQGIFISIAAYNSSPAIFGDDAHVFRPERWAELDARKATDNVQTTGVWSPLLTFLAGPRSCIGYKFALLELKACVSPFTRALTTRSQGHAQCLVGHRGPLHVCAQRRRDADRAPCRARLAPAHQGRGGSGLPLAARHHARSGRVE